MGKRIGISDVARLAGVSATTVSHALSGQGKVSPQTRLRVEEVASQLGYAPNRIASALRRQRSGIIGFVGDEVATTPFAGQLVLGAQDAAAEAGFLLMMVNSNRDAEVELGQIRALLAHQVDGIVYAKMYHREVEVPAVLGQLPVVIADAYDISERLSFGRSRRGADRRVGDGLLDRPRASSDRAPHHPRRHPGQDRPTAGLPPRLGTRGRTVRSRPRDRGGRRARCSGHGHRAWGVRQIPGVGNASLRCLLLQRSICDGCVSGGRDVRPLDSTRSLRRGR